MQYRSLKSSPTKQSLLGFGCMRFPLLEGTQEIDEKAAEAMIDYAYQNGVNYFDTAYIYHEGKSEGFIGKALKKYPRESFYLADKMPGWVGIKSVEDARRIFEEQLSRCQVDYFDFYLLHALTKEKDYTKVYLEGGAKEYLFEEKKKGRIRHLGFSFHGDEALLKKVLDDDERWDFVQIQLNYLDWNMQNAKAFYKLLEEYGISCIIMEPIRGGSLVKLPEASVEKMKKAAPEKTMAAWALEFTADLPNVVTILSGMSSMEQVKDNVKTLSEFKGLSKAEYEILQEVVEDYMQKDIIPCTACRYCMDCSFGVDIPGVFAVYNKAVQNNDLPLVIEGSRGNRGDIFLMEYDALTDVHQALQCTGCRKCEKLCPQNIKISGRMFEIKQLVQAAR